MKEGVVFSESSAHAPFRRLLALLAVAVAALLGAIVLGLSVGARPVPLVTLLDIFSAAPPDDPHATIVRDIRAPRVFLMALVGAALAPAGAAYQGMLRNPLADPYVLGVSSGAGLGATIVVSFLGRGDIGLMAVPFGAFAGALLAVLAVLLLARSGSHLPVMSTVLSGVAVGSMATSAMTLLMARSPDGLRRAFDWLFGGYAGGGWSPVLITAPWVALGVAVLIRRARDLNLLELGEEQAAQLGLDVDRARIELLGAATLMTAAAVAFGGLLGFVGLAVPHMIRLATGGDYRSLLPLSAVGGAAFLVLADLFARTAFSPREVPVGVVTALVGAPVFAWLLRRTARPAF